jgi:hypothetical protein
MYESDYSDYDVSTCGWTLTYLTHRATFVDNRWRYETDGEFSSARNKLKLVGVADIKGWVVIL